VEYYNYIKIIYYFLLYYSKNFIIWGLGIGDWGLGIGDWAQSPIPNPPSPIPKPPIFISKLIKKFEKIK